MIEKEISLPLIGPDVQRVDGVAKVTGAARFPSDEPLPNLAHAFLVTSTISRGRITGFDLTAARGVPGFFTILTYENVGGRIRPVPHLMKGGHVNSTVRPLGSPEIHYYGQIVALVVADTLEAAEDAAARVKVSYRAETVAATYGASGAEPRDLEKVQPGDKDARIGDAPAAFAAAAVKVEAEYETPPQHHNPMELFTTTASWDGPNLTIYEPTRFVVTVKYGVAQQLGLDPANVRVIARFLGGHFGSKFGLSQHTALVALAAREISRPVKLVPSREQCFTIATYRPESRHHLQLGATRDGRLTAFVHDAEQVTSRFDEYALAGTDVTSRLYASSAIATHVTLTRVDRNTPGPMRAPPEVPYLFALESAMDELAVALALDPVELRRRNDTTRDPVKGVPYSSRPLMACYDAAAAAFGWSRRNSQPRSTRDGAWLVGWGCASAMRPTQIAAASVRVRVDSDGRALVQTAHHEIGNGAMTIVAITAADALGIPVDHVTVELGDTHFPPASVSGGSTTTTSLCHAVVKACGEVRGRLTGTGARQGESLAQSVARVPGGSVDIVSLYLPPGASPEAADKLRTGRTAMSGQPKDHYSAAFGAQMVEVRVHARTGEIRVTRMVGAFAAGRIVDALTARSQLLGGMVWGLSSVLHEDSGLDDYGRYLNNNLERYLVPVNADVPSQEVILVPDDDRQVNALGIKGLGELGLIGVNAAIANAVFHATGKRIRKLPLRLEQLL